MVESAYFRTLLFQFLSLLIWDGGGGNEKNWLYSCREKKMAIELLYFQLSTSEEEITLDGISADLGELGFVGILSC